jgi:hypothetical protein
MAGNVWPFRVSPNPAFVFDVRRHSFTHPKISRDEHTALFPLFPARPCRNLAVKQRFRHEPLQGDTREWMLGFDTLHKSPRLLPCRAVILAGPFPIVTLLRVQLGQPRRVSTKSFIATKQFPNLGRDLLVLVERARVLKILRHISHKSQSDVTRRHRQRNLRVGATKCADT